MYCPNCGRELPHNDFARCPYCGAPLAASAVDNAPTAGPQGQTQPQTPANYTGPNAQTVLAPHGQPPAGPGQPAPGAPGYAPPANAGGPLPSTPLTPPLTPPPYAQGYTQTPTVSAPNQTYPGQGYGVSGYPPGPSGPQPPQPPFGRQFPLPLIIISVAILVALIVAVIVGVIKLTDNPGGSTSHTNGTPTATHTPPTATPSGTIIFQDALTSNAKGWQADETHCFFKSDGYHVRQNYFCTAPVAIPTGDITVSVNVKEVSGSNDFPFGIVLRRSGENYYAFEVDARGDWAFFKSETNATRYVKLRDFTANAAIRKGLNASNALKVVARDNMFSCYVNGTLVGQVTDSSYTNGQVGLISEKYEAVFTNILITQP